MSKKITLIILAVIVVLGIGIFFLIYFGHREQKTTSPQETVQPNQDQPAAVSSPSPEETKEKPATQGEDIAVIIEEYLETQGKTVSKNSLLEYLHQRQEEKINQMTSSEMWQKEGPHKQKISVTTSTNGLAMREPPVKEGIIPMAGVPDALVDQEGKIRIYFVSAMPLRTEIALLEEYLPEQVTMADVDSVMSQAAAAGSGAASNVNFMVAFSEPNDGIENWQFRAVAIKNFPGEKWITADPSIVILDDGSYRLYLCLQIPGGGAGQVGGTAYAESSDGIHFTYQGVAISNGLPDTEVHKFGTTFRAFLPYENHLRVLSSADGKSFSGNLAEAPSLWQEQQSTATRITTVPSGYRLYFGSPRTPGDLTTVTARSAFSADNGQTWTWADQPGIAGRGTQSVIIRPDGQYLHYF